MSLYAGTQSPLQISSRILDPATNLTEAELITNGPPIPGTLDATGTTITFAGVTIPAIPTNFTIANLRATTSFTTSPQVTAVITATGFGTAPSPLRFVVSGGTPYLGTLLSGSLVGTGPNVNSSTGAITDTTNGGDPPSTRSITSRALPAGLTLNTANGTISGTPTGTGPPFAMQAGLNGGDLINMVVTSSGSNHVNDQPGTAELTMSCVVSDGPSNVLTTYANICRAFGGTTPYTFSISAGALPAGVTLNPMTGGLFGAPTVTGAYQFTVEVTDSSAPTQTATQAFSGTIAESSSGGDSGGTPALTMSCTVSDGPSSTSTIYANICRVFGGTTPYTWSISSGALPAGVTLNSTTGNLFGAPIVTGVYQFTVEVTDSSSPIQTATQLFFGTITGSSGGGGGGGSLGPLTASLETLALTASPGIPATQTVTLTYSNSLAGAPNFTTAIQSSGPGGVNWLSVSPSMGTMTAIPGETIPHMSTATLTIKADPSIFIPGTTVTGTITYTANGSSDTTAVTMNVTDPPQLVASPQSLAFNYTQNDATLPAAQSFSVFSVPAGATFTASPSSNGNWLSASTDAGAVTPDSVAVSVSVAGLPLGTSTGSVTITGVNGSISVPVTLTIVKPTPPSPAVSPTLLSLSAGQGNNPVNGQVTVSNTGGETLNFTAQTSVSGSVPNWLTLTTTGGSATPSTPAAFSFKADPSGLRPGLYTGQITISAGGSSNQVTATVVLTVTPSDQTIQLSESGLAFSGVSGGPQPPAQFFTIANSGSGTLNWTAQTNTLSGQSWLHVSKPEGASLSGQAGTPVAVSADTAGLPPGQYYGSVNVASLNPTNSAQTISVILTVLPVQTTPGVTISTGGVILTGLGGTMTPPQTVNVFNPSSTPVTYTASISTANERSWLSVTPSSGPLNPGPNGIAFAADLSLLPSGVYTGSVSLAFSDGSSATIQVLALATGGTGSAVAGKTPHPSALMACNGGDPGFLIPVFQQPVSQATVSVAAPQTVQVEILDNCGNPMTAANAGTVQVNFSSVSDAGATNDSTISLQDIGGGLWQATWVPVNAGQVTLQVEAIEAGITLNPALNVGNSATATVQSATATSPPQATGAANAASAALAIPEVIAPGSYVAIYGMGLAGSGNPSAASLPLPTTLNGTQLLLGGVPMPLLYAGPTQVNALVPQGLAPNATYPLVVVANGGTVQSVPMALTVTELQPGVYTEDNSGAGAGVVTNTLTAQLISATNPAHANDYLTIYCTGLGNLVGANGEQQPADGAAAPTTVLYSTIKDVTVTATIGGINAPVLFSGLAPTLAALYQVNVQVPPGVAPGDAVPIVITEIDSTSGDTASSNPVTIFVQ